MPTSLPAANPSAAGTPLISRAGLITAVLAGLWINASEVVRYFVWIMPMMHEALPELPGVAPINATVFASWMLWDTVLVLVAVTTCWITLDRCGRNLRTALGAGTLVWAAVFVLFWLGALNLGLATPRLLAVALPLSWIELAIAGLIVRWGMNRFAPLRPAPGPLHSAL